MAATRFAIVLMLALAPACTDSANTVVLPVDPVVPAQGEGFARGTAMTERLADELSGEDYPIMVGKTATILAALNNGELAQATFAVQVVAAGDVFETATDMIIDHVHANAELDAAVDFYGIPYQPSSTAAALAAEASRDLASLRSTPPLDVGFRFVELQVITHAEAQVLLYDLAGRVGPSAIGDYIESAKETLAVHFAKSSDLLDTFSTLH